MMYSRNNVSNIQQKASFNNVEQRISSELQQEISDFFEQKINSFLENNADSLQGAVQQDKNQLSDRSQLSAAKTSRSFDEAYRKLNFTLQRPVAAGQCRAVFIWQMQDYRNLKELFGYQVADALQHRVTERLASCLSKYDVIEQIAEDEFCIVVNTTIPVHKISVIAQRLIERCSGVYKLGDECLHINAMLGIALYDVDSTDPEELMRFARLALCQEDEQSTVAYHFFSQEQVDMKKNHLRMIVEMEQAIKQDRLLLHYQPQYDMVNDKKIIAMEALVRMLDEEGNIIPPDQFIPLAEESGMIVTIGCWVINEACQQLKRWHDEGHTQLRMAINVSPMQLIDEHLTDFVTQAVIENGLSFSDLELEITEQCLLENTTIVEKVLCGLSEKGVRIALDDFGTGYSSLAYLANFPLNVLKLDRSFLAKAPEDNRSNQIISAILAMAEKLELEVVAEGIENEAQHQFLAEAGCLIGQGFGFSRPHPAAELQSLLKG